jgi:HEAT repeat protein
MGLLTPNVEKLVAARDVPGLIDALGDGRDPVRHAAAEALSQIGEPAIGLLVETLDETTKSFQPMPAGLNTFVSPAKARQVYLTVSILEALGGMGELAVAPLIAALRDKSLAPKTRGSLAGALGATGSRRAIRPLLFYAQAKCPRWVKEGAIWALSNFPEPAVVEGLLNVLDESGEMAEVATVTLAGFGDAARQALLDAVVAGVSEPGIVTPRCAYSACALAKLGDQRCFWALRRGFWLPDMHVRRAVAAGYARLLEAYANGLVPDDEGYPAVLWDCLHFMAAEDEYPEVRKAASVEILGLTQGKHPV